MPQLLLSWSRLFQFSKALEDSTYLQMNLNCTLCGRLFSVFGYLIVSDLGPNQGRNTVDAFVNTKNKPRADSYETFTSHWRLSFGYIKKKKWQFSLAFSFSPTLGASFSFLNSTIHSDWRKLRYLHGYWANKVKANTSCSGSEELTRGEEMKIPHSAWCHCFHLQHKCRLYFLSGCDAVATGNQPTLPTGTTI